MNYVSHEFKTPLASMLGNLEVFSLKDRSPEEYEDLSQKLIQQIYLLEEILNTLMVVSDLGIEAEINTTLRIDKLIFKIIEKVKINYPKAKIEVGINIAPEEKNLLLIHKNPTQLFMSLFNLIENGVKYSKGNMVQVDIYKQKNTLCISIADKGIGIPPEQLKHINKPFYRADNTDKIKGSGIGLAIALRILEKNDIKYQIQSEINKGTKITLVF